MMAKQVLMAMMVYTVFGFAAAQPVTSPLVRYCQTEKRVSELDWNLLQFNLLWHDSYGKGEYVRSFPVSFNNETMTFEGDFRVAEKRDYQDPEPFSTLTETRQREILQSAVDYLVRLLGRYFPQVESIQKHVRITFTSQQLGGSSVTIATYAKGRLQFHEK